MLHLASLGGVLITLIQGLGGVLSHVSHTVTTMCDTPIWLIPS
jgi:hypothetical protein